MASFALTRRWSRNWACSPEDNEGLIDNIRAIEGVIVAAFFEELPEGKVRISLRSKTPRVDVCKVCQQFGGGGHTLAAGARVRGPHRGSRRESFAAICHEFDKLK